MSISTLTPQRPRTRISWLRVLVVLICTAGVVVVGNRMVSAVVTGLDEPDAPVFAAADGTVIRAGVNGGYGNQIVVHHGTLRGQGVASSYNHLSGYAVRGASVSRGQVIGYVGTTGTSTRCHLHFEMYVNGSTQNPMNWL